MCGREACGKVRETNRYATARSHVWDIWALKPRKRGYRKVGSRLRSCSPDLIIGLTSVKHLLLPCLAVIAAWTCTGAQRSRSDARIDFKRDIEPILISRCYSCHGPKSQISG